MSRRPFIPIQPPPGWNPPVSDEWAAGLFEGEGCLHQNGRGYWELKLGMTDLDVIQRYAHWAGVGLVSAKASPSHQARVAAGREKQIYNFALGGANAIKPVLRMRPFMGERRGHKFDLFLDWAAGSGHMTRALQQP